MSAKQWPERLPRVGPGIYTETLARLYTQQGFFDQALDIYRHLAQTQPHQQYWQERILALEHQQAAVTATTVGLHSTGAGPTGHRPHQARERRVLEHLERWLRVLRQQRLA